MDSVGIVVVAVAILAFGLVSRRLQSSILTPPMMFVVLGVAIGPRGIASILFALLVVEPMLPHSEEILTVVTITVLLSVFLHGMTAAPVSRAYGRRVRSAGDDAHEMQHVDEHPLRIRPLR